MSLRTCAVLAAACVAFTCQTRVAPPSASTPSQHTPGYLGIGFSVDNVSGAVTVLQVMAGSPADTGGLRIADVVDALDGVPIRASSHRSALEQFAGVAAVDEPLSVVVLRDGGTVELTVTPTEPPEGTKEHNLSALQCVDGGRRLEDPFESVFSLTSVQ